MNPQVGFWRSASQGSGAEQPSLTTYDIRATLLQLVPEERVVHSFSTVYKKRGPSYLILYPS